MIYLNDKYFIEVCYDYTDRIEREEKMLAKISEEELLSYKGMAKMPADFDDYWKRALEEMERTDPRVEIKRVEINFNGQECFEIYFTGVGGARVYARYMRPVNAEKCPIVFKFHGYSARFDNWFDSLPHISQGMCVATLDCRGQGGKSEDTVPVHGNTLHGHIIRGIDDDIDKLYYRNQFLDTAQLVKIVREFSEIDDTRMYTMGGSQGGGLAIACAALVPDIKRVAAYEPFLSDYRYAYINNETSSAFYELVEYARLFDSRHEHIEETFDKLDYIDIQNLAKYVKAEVLMCSGLKDVSVNVMTQFAMFNKLNVNKKFYLYPERGHERLDGSDDLAIQWMNE